MQPAKAAHSAFLARRKLASGSSRAPCAFPNLRCCPRCWLFSCLGLCSHPHISPKEHQKERCGHSRPQRSFIMFHGALRNILLPAGFPAMFLMITLEQTFVNGLLQKIFSCCHRVQIESILPVIYISLLTLLSDDLVKSGLSAMQPEVHFSELDYRNRVRQLCRTRSFVLTFWQFCR